MRTYRYENEYLREISMPVGGIGAGCIGLAGNGRLIDWELERPDKGNYAPYTHFAVKAETESGVIAKVLQGDTYTEYSGHYKGSVKYHTGFGYGPDAGTMAGFPHFRGCVFEGAFPYAKLTLRDDDFPAVATLEAFSAFIPHEADESSRPCAFYTVTLTNTSAKTVVYYVSFTLGTLFDSAVNRRKKGDGFDGLVIDAGDRQLCALTDAADTSVQTHFYRGGWFDSQTAYWHEYTRRGYLPERMYDTPGRDPGTIEARFTLDPGESRSVNFVLAWYFPTFTNYWDKDGDDRQLRRYYSHLYPSAFAAARSSLAKFASLRARTMEFTEALYSCSLPVSVLEAAGASLSVLVTQVCLRLDDGSFWGFEGEIEKGGSCEGSCQHVWNYAYALPFLFPELEKSVRRLERDHSQWPDGHLSFRLRLPPGRGAAWEMPCVDGQMGYILKIYREWKTGGGAQWLKEMYPSAKRAMDFTWADSFVKWDSEKRGVLTGRQHHTLDMELFGPSGWLQGFYAAALKAMGEMARAMGDDPSEYEEMYLKARAHLNNELFNGRYYIQKLDLRDTAVLDPFPGTQETYLNSETGELKYQIGEGLIIDQALAQWHADMAGLGDIYDEDKLKSALDSLYTYNFKPSMRAFANPCRVFSLDDEGGTVMCEYPPDVYKPVIPIPYCQETMTGFEYAAAALMARHLSPERAEEMVKAVRDRYDGKKRNPWNELECGSNYARSMAAFSFISVWMGYTCDAVRGTMRFEPINGETRGLWSMSGTWGTVSVEGGLFRLELKGKPLGLKSIELPGGITDVIIDGTPCAAFGQGQKYEIERLLTARTGI